MLKKFMLLTVCCSISFLVNAQYNETIRSGRPGQAIGPFVTGKGIFQIQSGVDLTGNEVGNIETSSMDLNTVIRYSTSDFFEINGAVTYSWLDEAFNEFNRQYNGLSQTEIGVRTNILNSKNNFPSLGFQYRLKIPSPSDEFRSDNTASLITFVTAQTIAQKIGLTTNWGINWDGDTGNENGFFVINLNTGISEKLGMFGEFYGTFADKNWEGKVDGGFAYLVNNDLQLDMLAGWGSFGIDKDNFFAGLGISWRTKKRN